MSSSKCCVPGCKNTRASSNLVLHCFPNPRKDLERFKSWLIAVNGNIVGLDNDFIYKYRRVCHSHFENKYVFYNNRLSPQAVPTLGILGCRQSTKKPLQDISNLSMTPGSSTQAVAIRTSEAGPSRAAVALEECVPSTSRPLRGPETGKPSTKKPSVLNRTEWTYYKDLLKIKKKLEKTEKKKQMYATKLKSATKLASNPAFQKSIADLTTAAKIFTMLQLREAKKPKMGRRFTHEEKLLTLTLYKNSPKSYKFLRQLFVLPSPSQLNRLLSKASLKPGFNDNIFKQLQKKVEKMKDSHKLCILMFDEMALQPHFDYNERKDYVSGLAHNGTTDKMKIADHALVFMIRGIFKNYKQPIYYSFSSQATPKYELANQIRSIIQKLQCIGLNVLATVCDQSAPNVSGINALIDDTKANYLREGKELRHDVFEIDGREIVPLYDPPHLIKGIRNNLLNKNLKFEINGTSFLAKWDHIIALYEENAGYKGIRLMPKLTDRHVIPNVIPKMKVKLATQVFSKNVASNMGYFAEKGILPEDCKDTAELLLFFDDLFDSFNGSFHKSNKHTGKPLLGRVTPKSVHHAFWKKALVVLKSMKFVDENGVEKVVPSLKNWILTLENIEYLLTVLEKKYDITSVWLRHFNQDPLENFFGSIRSHGSRNVMPTCSQFEAAFTALLVNNISSPHSPAANCETDSCDLLYCLDLLLTGEEPQLATTFSCCDLYNDSIFIGLEQKSNIKIRASLEYVTGYILRKAQSRIYRNCQTCKNDLHSTTEHEYLKKREYLDKFWLKSASLSMVNCFSNMQDIITFYLSKGNVHNVKSFFKTMVTLHMDFDFITCETHKTSLIAYFTNLSTRFFIFNWCRDLNKILKGIRRDYDVHDQIQSLAVIYKYRKKK